MTTYRIIVPFTPHDKPQQSSCHSYFHKRILKQFHISSYFVIKLKSIEERESVTEKLHALMLDRFFIRCASEILNQKFFWVDSLFKKQQKPLWTV